MSPAVGSFGAESADPARQSTAAVLDEFADRCVIAHEVSAPHRDETIAHVVVSGESLLMLDSRIWPAGYYHGLTSRLRRGASVWDAETVAFESLAAETAQAMAHRHGGPITFDTTVMVWPASRLTVVSWSCRRLEPVAKPAETYLASTVEHLISSQGPAEPHLADLVISAADGSPRS